MFNLEPSIAEWRRQMLAAGIKTPVPLEELEIHLREDVERQVRSGVNAQKAFKAAVQQIGQPNVLNREFKKSERTSMKRPLIILAGIFVLLMGTTMILPALGNHEHHNQAALSAGANYFTIEWAHNEMVGLAWEIPLAICGMGTTLYGFKKRKA
jgi:hypothetical protein